MIFALQKGKNSLQKCGIRNAKARAKDVKRSENYSLPTSLILQNMLYLELEIRSAERDICPIAESTLAELFI